MKELRLSLLTAAIAVPLAWSAKFGAETRVEALNQVLLTLLVGVIPLLAGLLLWSEDFAGADIDVRYGRDRRAFAAQRLLRVLGVLTLASILAGALPVLLIRGWSDAALGRDLLATLGVCLAGALATGTYLSAARAWLGKWGLGFALLLAWLIGPLDVIISALVPTGHIRFLIGVGAEYPFPGWVSLLSLYGMSGVLGAALFARVPR